MKQHRIVIAFFCTIFLFGCSSEGDFTYLDGEKGRFDAFKGQWLLINYWAEWCKPCIKEIPELNTLAKSQEIKVIGINFDVMDINAETALNEKFNIQYPVVRGNFQAHFQFEMPNSLPTSILINPEGKVEHILLGPQSKESIEKLIRNTGKL